MRYRHARHKVPDMQTILRNHAGTKPRPAVLPKQRAVVERRAFVAQLRRVHPNGMPAHHAGPNLVLNAFRHAFFAAAKDATPVRNRVWVKICLLMWDAIQFLAT